MRRSTIPNKSDFVNGLAKYINNYIHQFEHNLIGLAYKKGATFKEIAEATNKTVDGVKNTYPKKKFLSKEEIEKEKNSK